MSSVIDHPLPLLQVIETVMRWTNDFLSFRQLIMALWFSPTKKRVHKLIITCRSQVSVRVRYVHVLACPSTAADLQSGLNVKSDIVSSLTWEPVGSESAWSSCFLYILSWSHCAKWIKLILIGLHTLFMRPELSHAVTRKLQFSALSTEHFKFCPPRASSYFPLHLNSPHVHQSSQIKAPRGSLSAPFIPCHQALSHRLCNSVSVFPLIVRCLCALAPHPTGTCPGFGCKDPFETVCQVWPTAGPSAARGRRVSSSSVFTARDPVVGSLQEKAAEIWKWVLVDAHRQRAEL